MPEITPPEHHRLEVECDQAMVALEKLRGLDGVADATLFGQNIHLLARREVHNETIRAALAGAGLHVHDVREIEPSLEDVFVMLTRKRTAELAAQG
jgi:hypothetical protein